MFKKGQKLEWIDYDGLGLEKVGRIVTCRYIEESRGRLYVILKEETGMHYIERFKAVEEKEYRIIKEENIKLEAGMRVINTDNNCEFTIVNQFALPGLKMIDDNYELYACNATTIQELSKATGCLYEVVND